MREFVIMYKKLQDIVQSCCVHDLSDYLTSVIITNNLNITVGLVQKYSLSSWVLKLDTIYAFIRANRNTLENSAHCSYSG